ncbi:hypothetical protein CK203_059726 [Vitis vinifera]|uniref:Uncharacterized protein n=1 Tax=Vitis vinifera TaxID=29760 RepID=A0A438G7Q4_VITVI|nr:hypothetical protein CK203_059726 [Vitis vinifera]
MNLNCFGCSEFVKDNVREAKKANRQAREARKRPCRNELVD